MRTYDDMKKIFDDDLLSLHIDCKPVVRRECDRSSVVAAWDEAKLGVCRGIPERDVVCHR